MNSINSKENVEINAIYWRKVTTKQLIGSKNKTKKKMQEANVKLIKLKTGYSTKSNYLRNEEVEIASAISCFVRNELRKN